MRIIGICLILITVCIVILKVQLNELNNHSILAAKAILQLQQIEKERLQRKTINIGTEDKPVYAEVDR